MIVGDLRCGVQEAEAKRKRREKDERQSRGRHLPGAVQLHAELQAMPDDEDEDLGDRRSGTPRRRVATGALAQTCILIDDVMISVTVSTPSIGPLRTLDQDVRTQQRPLPDPKTICKRPNISCCYGTCPEALMRLFAMIFDVLLLESAMSGTPLLLEAPCPTFSPHTRQR